MTHLSPNCPASNSKRDVAQSSLLVSKLPCLEPFLFSFTQCPLSHCTASVHTRHAITSMSTKCPPHSDGKIHPQTSLAPIVGNNKKCPPTPFASEASWKSSSQASTSLRETLPAGDVDSSPRETLPAGDVDSDVYLENDNDPGGCGGARDSRACGGPLGPLPLSPPPSLPPQMALGWQLVSAPRLTSSSITDDFDEPAGDVDPDKKRFDGGSNSLYLENDNDPGGCGGARDSRACGIPLGPPPLSPPPSPPPQMALGWQLVSAPRFLLLKLEQVPAASSPPPPPSPPSLKALAPIPCQAVHTYIVCKKTKSKEWRSKVAAIMFALVSILFSAAQH